jgi:hypothetical protein
MSSLRKWKARALAVVLKAGGGRIADKADVSAREKNAARAAAASRLARTSERNFRRPRGFNRWQRSREERATEPAMTLKLEVSF